jgi:hypothetical protein
MTMTLVLKSGVTGNCYAPFGSGGGVGDRPADHNCATRSPETGVIRGMGGKGRSIFDNCVSI